MSLEWHSHSLHNIPKRFMKGITRYATLLWELGDDDDLGLKLRITTEHQGTMSCSQCPAPTRSFPFGIDCSPICERCIAQASSTAFQSFTFEELKLPPTFYNTPILLDRVAAANATFLPSDRVCHGERYFNTHDFSMRARPQQNPACIRLVLEVIKSLVPSKAAVACSRASWHRASGSERITNSLEALSRAQSCDTPVASQVWLGTSACAAHISRTLEGAAQP